MAHASAETPGALLRLHTFSRILYKEAQYWLVGLTPEHYHLYQARRWSELHKFDASARHLRKYLACSNKPQVRAELGWCLAVLGRWTEAVEEYEMATAQWPHTSLRLALAEAHLRSGNPQRGAAIVRELDVEGLALEGTSRQALADLKKELGLVA